MNTPTASSGAGRWLAAARQGALALALALMAGHASAAVVRIDRIVLTVADLDRTEAFYRDALGFQAVQRTEHADAATQRLLGVPSASRSLTMQLGGQRVEFTQFRDAGRPYPAGSQSADLWFQHFAIVVSDIDAAYARLQSVAFQPISIGGPQTLPEEDGHVRAYKFRDPDGHPLELIYFPPGTGRAVWAGTGRRPLTLGIDHTAIGISRTPASMAFYAGLLGLSQAYEVLNRGPRQDDLDATFDAMVRITGMRPAAPDGPGVEFLDYRAPPTGRTMPADSRGNDLWHAHVVMAVDDLDRLIRVLDDAGVRFVSPGIVPLSDGHKAAAVLDPDGHPIVLEQ